MSLVTVQLYPYTVPAKVLQNVQAGQGGGTSQIGKSASDVIGSILGKVFGGSGKGGSSGGGSSGGGSSGGSGGSGSGDQTPGYTAGMLVNENETVWFNSDGDIVDANGNVVITAADLDEDSDGNILDENGDIVIPADQVSDNYYDGES